MSARLLKKIRKNMDEGGWLTAPDRGPGTRSSRKRRLTYDGGRRPIERKRGTRWIKERYRSRGGADLDWSWTMPPLPKRKRRKRDYRTVNRDQEQARRRRQRGATR